MQSFTRWMAVWFKFDFDWPLYTLRSKSSSRANQQWSIPPVFILAGRSQLDVFIRRNLTCAHTQTLIERPYSSLPIQWLYWILKLVKSRTIAMRRNFGYCRGRSWNYLLGFEINDNEFKVLNATLRHSSYSIS